MGFTPKGSMLYIFPALLFILKDLFLIPRILEHYSDTVSGLLDLSGIVAACIVPQEWRESGLCPVGG